MDISKMTDGELLEELTTPCILPAECIALQHAINSGMAWRLQGSYGRVAMEALRDGACMLPASPKPLEALTEADLTRDYYGNVVPFRDMLKDGTKGTRGLVVAMHGEAYAAALEALDARFDLRDVEALEG